MLKHWKRTLALLGVVAATGLVCAAVTLGAKKPPAPPPTPPSGPGLIAFNDAALGIAVMNPDGTGRTRVATFSALSFASPAWSHTFSDGTVKVFWRESDSLPLMAVDVVPEIGDPVAVPDVDVNGWATIDLAPSVPREGGTESVRICYEKRSTNPDGSRRWDIKVVQLIYNPQTGAFTVDPATAPVVIEAPWGTSYGAGRFSPDGTWIAFRADNSELGEDSIRVAKSDGSEPPVLVADAAGFSDWNPTWSPDGSRLAFMSKRDTKNPWQDGDIYVALLNPDMSAASIERKTYSTKIGEAHISWSPADPNGEQISYMHSGGALAIKDYSLGKVMLLTGQQHDLGKGCYPDWSPMDLPKLP